MGTSRRVFLRQSAETIGAVALAQLACTQRTGQPALGGAATPSGPAFEPAYLALERSGELERREAALWEILRGCRLCPRECGANRIAGEKGVCSSTGKLKLHSAGPHFGEEPPLVGRNGSGTVFFSNCNFLFCAATARTGRSTTGATAA